MTKVRVDANLHADNPALRRTCPPGSIVDMRISDLNAMRTSDRIAKPRRLTIGCKERARRLVMIAIERGVSAQVVFDDAVGRWIDAHHEPWTWTSRPHVSQPLRAGSAQTRWYPARRDHLRAVERASEMYEFGEGELIIRAIDAHLMRNGMYSRDDLGGPPPPMFTLAGPRA